MIALDLTIYTQHVVFHYVPVLWRLHRMHHADLDIDVTTGVRFHPLEILLSLAIKMAAVVALGVPALGVLIFEVLLNATSMFNHSNVGAAAAARAGWRAGSWSPRRCIRCITRSSARRPTAISALICRGGTACSAPTAPSRRRAKQGMTIGLPIFRDVAELRIVRLLTQPFREPRIMQSAEHQMKQIGSGIPSSQSNR